MNKLKFNSQVCTSIEQSQHLLDLGLKPETEVCFQDTNYEDKVELQLGNNYEIKKENGKYYAIKKQFKYPKTYEECCNILGCKA